jgi:hypothetical protein
MTEQIGAVLRGNAGAGEIGSFGSRAWSIVEAVLEAMRDQSIDHAPLVIFSLAATVLLLFMLRT